LQKAIPKLLHNEVGVCDIVLFGVNFHITDRLGGKGALFLRLGFDYFEHHIGVSQNPVAD